LEKIHVIPLTGVSLVVCCLFLPWVTWEGHPPTIPPGSTEGFETVSGYLLLIFAIIGGYFSLQKPTPLNTLVVIFLGMTVLFGALLDKIYPQGFAPSVVSKLCPSTIHLGVGLDVGAAGGAMILLYGIFRIIEYLLPFRK